MPPSIATAASCELRSGGWRFVLAVAQLALLAQVIALAPGLRASRRHAAEALGAE